MGESGEERTGLVANAESVDDRRVGDNLEAEASGEGITAALDCGAGNDGGESGESGGGGEFHFGGVEGMCGKVVLRTMRMRMG